MDAEQLTVPAVADPAVSKRFLILANPIAGGGRARQQAPQLQEELQKRGCAAEVYFSGAAGDIGRRAAQVGSGDFDAIVSVGGDGTLNEVLNGLPDPTLPLCPMAMGTANVLSLELRLPRQPEPLAEILAAGRTLEAAIGLCKRPTDREPRRFLLFASAGMDASIVQRLEQVRTGTLGKLAWTRPILHTKRTDVTTVVVTRVHTYGGILKLPGPIDITDGHLHVLLFRQRTRWQYLCAMLRALAGRLRIDEDVEFVPAKELEIRQDPIQQGQTPAPYQVDGDLGGEVTPDRPLRISLFPEAARLFADPAMIPQ
jgi:diacylglycerol kinase family enzyme